MYIAPVIVASVSVSVYGLSKLASDLMIYNLLDGVCARRGKKIALVRVGMGR